MTAIVAGVLNLFLGAVYWGIGSLIAVDLEQSMRRRGWSHFGVAWLTIMFTCGAHHLVHGVHLTAEGRSVGDLDILAVAMGVPAGIIWSALRIDAHRGGRGDRFVAGTPAWLRVLGWGYGLLTGVCVVAAVAVLRGGVGGDPRVLPNVFLLVLYVGIGWYLYRGQRRNRRGLGGWSTSGLALMMIFPTCAMMHGVYVVYASVAAFSPDYHGLWADWLSVPAALYFFWVVQGLEHGTVRDWNTRFEAIDDLAEPDRRLVGVGG